MKGGRETGVCTGVAGPLMGVEVLVDVKGVSGGLGGFRGLNYEGRHFGERRGCRWRGLC